MTDITDVKNKAEAIKSAYSGRDEAFKEYEDMYNLKDDTLPKGNWIKPTIDPDPRNSTKGAERLLGAGDPIWEMPYDLEDTDAEEQSSSIEMWAESIWNQAGRVTGKPRHYPAIKTALIWDEVHIITHSVADAIARANNPGQKRRLEYVQQHTPLLFDVLSPRTGYAEYDLMGMSAYYSPQMRTVAYIKSLYGKEVGGALDGKKSSDRLKLHDYWDWNDHAVWIDEVDKPLVAMEHGLSAIPVSCQVIEGENLFENVEDQRQPFLYTLRKSGMWNRASLAQTVLYSVMFSLASNPQFVAVMSDPTADLEVDWDEPGGIIKMKVGESFQALAKNIIDPSLFEGLTLAEKKMIESTIYRQTLGEPLGGNAPFSMVSLLNQSGRLPLVPYQRMLSWVIADAMYKGFHLVKQSKGKTTNVSGDSGMLEIDKGLIPDFFDLRATLDITLPQDDRLNAEVAGALVEKRLASKRHVREKILKIGQSTNMTKEIWGEQMGEAKLETMIMMQMEKMKQQFENMAQQAAQTGSVDLSQQQQIDPMQQQQQVDPNMMDPNMMDPAMMDPGMMDPNMMDPAAQGQIPGGGPGMPGLPLNEPVDPMGGAGGPGGPGLPPEV